MSDPLGVVSGLISGDSEECAFTSSREAVELLWSFGVNSKFDADEPSPNAGVLSTAFEVVLEFHPKNCNVKSMLVCCLSHGADNVEM